MTAKPALDVSIGSDFQENPVEGTLTSASSWHSARLPVNRNCCDGFSYCTGSPVDLQTILNVIRAGVAIESNAGHLGWSTTGTSFISNVTVFPSALTTTPAAGTGTTQ